MGCIKINERDNNNNNFLAHNNFSDIFPTFPEPFQRLSTFFVNF